MDKVNKDDIVKRRSRLSPARQMLLEKRLKGEVLDDSQHKVIPRRSGHSPAPLSFAQQRLWFLDQLIPGSPAYNISAAVRLLGRLNASVLEQALNEVVRRHETLRTLFPAYKGQPRQVIIPALPITMVKKDLAGLTEEEKKVEVEQRIREESRRLFDLEQGPLLRTMLLRLGKEEHLLILTMHHIISDDWSMGVFIREISLLYQVFSAGQTSPLPPLPIQYADFACWQRQWLQGEILNTQLDYWKQQLAGAPSALNLPTDRPRPAVNNFRGARHLVKLDEILSKKLKALSQQEGTTLFMTLLAAFKTLLSQYSSQEDILVGTPIANRNRADIEGLIGFFVNTLVIRTDLSGNPTFRELLGRVRENALKAYSHQDLPFEKMVEELQPERDLSRNPFFQVMFILQNAQELDLTLPGLALDLLEIQQETALFDLTLEFRESTEGLKGWIEFNRDLFDMITIERMAHHFLTLLEHCASQPDCRLGDLSLMTPAERQQVLVEWNRTHLDYPHDKCIHHLVEARAEQTPDAAALIFADQCLTYRELNQRANQLAYQLQNLGVGPEILVAICIERTPQLVVALCGILKAGGAYVPLDRAYPPRRQELMLKDTRAAVLLTEAHRAEEFAGLGTHVVCPDTGRESPEPTCHKNPHSGVTAANLAYVIYTSGSTGMPKGTAIAHKNTVAFIHWAKEVYSAADLDGVLASTSICFDISVFELFVPLSQGGKIILVENILALPELAGADGVTLINTVPSAMAELIRMKGVPPTAVVVNLAGEPLRSVLVKQLYQEENIRDVYDLYGPSESTTYSTFTRRSSDGAETIGTPIGNTQVYLLDSHREPVPVGVAGELYIGGAGLARGYLNHPDLTVERFIPHPFKAERGEHLYRTGDLGRYLADGNLQFLGRVDHQVKIRGFRIEPGEIETTLEQHPAVKETVVMIPDDKTGDLASPGAAQRLVAYVVPTEGEVFAANELRGFLEKKLPGYMVPWAFVTLERIPLLPGGKVDRRALPAPDLDRPLPEHTFVPPQTPVEEMMTGLWTNVLGLERIGIHDNFFQLGGHSLLATRLISRVRDTFQVELSLRSLFESPTIADLAAKIQQQPFEPVNDNQTTPGVPGEKRETHVPLLRPVPREGQVPLSFAQQRLWFIEQLLPGSPVYNICSAVHLVGALEAAALHQGLREILKRHETFRTTFAAVNGHPVQVIADNAEIPLPVVDLQELSQGKRSTEIQRRISAEGRKAFDLKQGPLLRTTLLRLTPREHILLLTMHHIIADGWSINVFINELTTLYHAFIQGRPSPLTLPPVQYADFTLWQRKWLQGEVLEKRLSYWCWQLDGLPLLKLPTDYPRPAVNHFRGALYPLLVSREVTRELKMLSQREGVTLFTTLLAAFKALLYRYTDQQDMVVGTVIANRNRSEIEGLVGFFANTLVMRTDLSGNPEFKELLARVREVVLEAHAHQDLPFEKLVEEIQPERDMSRNPLFQVAFVLQNFSLPPLELGELSLSLMEVDNKTAKFDLTLFLWEEAGGLKGNIEYNTDIFAETTIRRLAGHLNNLLANIAAQPDCRLRDLSLLTPTERQQVLVEWNRTHLDYPRDKCIHHLVEARAEQTPDAAALVFTEQCLTYRELNRQANQLAYQLQNLGVGPEILVAICIERTPQLVVALCGILKAGGAYVPLDRAYPPRRQELMLKDTRAAVLLTEAHRAEEFAGLGTHVVCPDTGRESPEPTCHKNPHSGVTAANLAYVIYTSGSTGMPKGTAIAHKNTVAFIHWAKEVYSAADLDGVLASTSICFDISVFELFVPLSQGGKIILVENILALPELAGAVGVTLINTVPSAMAELIRMKGVPPTAVVVNLAGEPLRSALVKQLYQEENIRDVYDLYGPSESTTYSTFAHRSAGGAETIGTPIGNTQVYLLDSHREPVPVGVAGELYIGGAGLARGYLNHPDLTVERFIPHPFKAERGEHLYRTGDLGRYLTDGNLQFLGRIDHQVKVRGFRIEPGEIETTLEQHPAVKETVVMIRDDEPGDQRLTAYVVPDSSYNASEDRVTAWQDQQISEWQQIFEKTYKQDPGTGDSLLNTAGWVSSYTGLPIPPHEMAQWVEQTVERILTLQPRRVLEIGCGTGLLLFPLAPHCTHYCGTDFSPFALDYVRQQLRDRHLPQVTLLERTAEDFTDLAEEHFDLVIINSVLQYFPDIDYLLQVLENALEVLGPGGFIFVGDVRSLPLLEVFHTSVQLVRAPPSLSIDRFKQQVQRVLRQDQELVIDPAFFKALPQHFPAISYGQVLLKRGRYHNEMTRFRYDVILHTGTNTRMVSDYSRQEWQNPGFSVGDIRQFLLENEPQVHVITHVPNERLLPEAKALEELSGDDHITTVANLRKTLESVPAEMGLDPEDVWTLSRELPYSIDIGWCDSRRDGSFDILFRRHTTTGKTFPLFPQETRPLRPWSAYANHPLQGKLTQQLVPQLRKFLLGRVPEYMVPATFVFLTAMPLTPNGKINRRELPIPEGLRPNLETYYTPPRTEAERKITAVWEEVLQIEKVGCNDNFFDLGGHSLLVVRVHSKLQELFKKELSIIELFKYPTISSMARHLTGEDEGESSQISQQSAARAGRRKGAMTRQMQFRQQQRTARKQ